MLVSLKWLREYVDLPAQIDVDALATRLTMASAEVEGIHRIGEWDRQLVTVGHVLAVDPHPNADRLRLATVDYGGSAPLQVVCGAPNLALGQRIAFARAGAMLHDPHSGEVATLKASKIRGVASAGMVLSEAELGLSQSHEGIIVLPEDAPIGAPLADYLGDVVIDVHTWHNRADTMCMLGIARELAALYDLPLRLPDETYAAGGAPARDAVAVEITAPELCQRYVATVVEGVHVHESPGWMQERLRAAGMRPINNIVDITNYAMLELGQPLHAFDLARVRGPVVVRRARAGERLTTLDGEDRALTPDTLLIADDSGPIALAGVMGGASTEVTTETTAVLLEAARFDPSSIRRTSMRIVRSEASRRFERGLSPELAAHAVRRATQLLVTLAGGTARAGVVDVYPQPAVPPTVAISRRRLDTVTGLHVPTAEVVRGLHALGCEVASAGEGVDERFSVRPPWWRTDITIADDVAEEVLRLAGYDDLPATTPGGRIPAYEPQPLLTAREASRDALAAAGLREVITYSLTTDAVLARVLDRPADAPAPLRLRNTLSADQEVLRPTLRHSILETVARNVRGGADQIAIFEIAHVYIPRAQHEPGAPLPDEHEMITGAVSGFEVDRWGTRTGRALDFFDAKSALEALADVLGVAIVLEPVVEFGLLPGRTARVLADGQPIGVIGDVHPDTLRAFAIPQAVTLFDLDLDALLRHVPTRRAAQPVSRFPTVEQDIAVVVDESVSAEAILERVRGSALVRGARIFDVYRGEPVPSGQKSVAIAIQYQAMDRTLTTDDANREQERILRRLTRDLGATLRG